MRTHRATTLRRRFHVPVTQVPEGLVRRLVSPRDGWSVLAEQCGSGVGSRLLRDVARDAHARGYLRLVCLAEPDNDAVLPTVRRAGLEGVPEQVDGVVQVVVPLPARRRGLRRPA